jgi:hypothetical protein
MYISLCRLSTSTSVWMTERQNGDPIGWLCADFTVVNQNGMRNPVNLEDVAFHSRRRFRSTTELSVRCRCLKRWCSLFLKSQVWRSGNAAISTSLEDHGPLLQWTTGMLRIWSSGSPSGLTTARNTWSCLLGHWIPDSYPKTLRLKNWTLFILWSG